MLRSFLIIGLWLVTLVGGAQTSAPDWHSDRAAGDKFLKEFHLAKAAACYERALENPAIKDSIEAQLVILRHVMDCYDQMVDTDPLTQTIFRLRKLAEEHGNKAFEAISYATSGRWHHYNGQKAKGYEYCLKAVEMMKATDHPYKHVDLRDFYGHLVRMYARDGRYDEALRMSQLQEAEAREPAPTQHTEDADRGLRRVYALRADALAMAGRMGEADKAYATWKKICCASNFDDIDIYRYLYLSRHYDEALDVLKRYGEYLQQEGDTASYRMLSLLNRKAVLYAKMGNFEDATVTGTKVGELALSLHTKRMSTHMQTTYNLLKEQDDSNRKTLWLSMLLLLIVMLVLLGVVVLYYMRHIRRRNRTMLKVLNGLDAYRRAVINGEPPTSPEVVAAIEELQSINLPGNEPAEDSVEEPDDEDRRLFVEMDMQVTRDQLFLKPGLGRDDLMRLIGVDKNRFGKMMSKYSDASNTSVYINTKRVEFGARLLVEHPEYTIATIATECGMSNTVTFNRTFKEVYNMTPSEYKEIFVKK
jgi:AraC-like DNA-binding protein/tetratricopeptide (TPR) repeat protein